MKILSFLPAKQASDESSFLTLLRIHHCSKITGYLTAKEETDSTGNNFVLYQVKFVAATRHGHRIVWTQELYRGRNHNSLQSNNSYRHALQALLPTLNRLNSKTKLQVEVVAMSGVVLDDQQLHFDASSV